jgi:hypothetical protein
VTLDFSRQKVNRLTFTVEPVEGTNCDINCFLVPEVGDGFGQSITVPLKPLCSHFKISELPPNLEMNKMTITGEFTSTQMNNWLF